ncbi:type-F conjugative transfer system secretin TraK [Yersinia enterocolitica]
MKNNLLALWLGSSLLLSGSAFAQPPSTLTFPQGGQFRLTISNSDPNMIFIPGDRITAITAQNSMLADKRLTSAGGVLFTSVAKKPFTLFVETELGQSFSVVATPVNGEGRIYRLVSEEVPQRPKTRQWETAQPYEKLLVKLARATLTGELPEEYGEVKPLADGIRIPSGLVVTLQQAWAGDQLRVDRYLVRNKNTWGIALREQDFWKPGVRAVVFGRGTKTLLSSGSMPVVVIRATEEGNDGQPQ